MSVNPLAPIGKAQSKAQCGRLTLAKAKNFSMTESQFTLAWWNTALSPTRKKGRASAAERAAAASVLSLLTGSLKADLIALGEVSQEDVERLRVEAAAALDGYTVVPMMEKAGRSAFDTCLMHRKHLIVGEPRPIIKWKLDRSTRIGQAVEILLPSVSMPLHVFV